MRTHTCGDLREKHIGKEVTLCGWVSSFRTHGGVLFVDLRDRYGITQIVFNKDPKFAKEDVIQVTGKVRKRPQPNKKIPTGSIEVELKEHKLLNCAIALPIDLSGTVESTDETRLKYRYLDLRMKKNMDNILFRHQVIKAAREFMDKNNFIEIETPLLVKSTPEGARDYLVPSRVNKHKFYALPQSPQLYKQILMIAGFDRYYQIAKCLRDEDLRADRQPEHTQIDFEMSFSDADKIRSTVEQLFKHIFKTTLNIKLEKFPLLTYKEAMSRFGTDKPDMRFDLELNDVTEIVKKSDFNVFKQAEHIVSITVDKTFSRKEIDKLTKVAQTYGAKGLAYLTTDGGISKFLTEDIKKQLKLKPNQTMFFVADKKKTAQTALGQVRLALRDHLELIKDNTFKFVWVYDFPLFSYNEDENRWEPEHHMFSMPKEQFIKDFEKHPEKVLGDLWDLTLNGVELASGSIRVSQPELQKRIMKFIGMSEKEANEKFGFLLVAYKYGGPQHGGMGIGIDRVIALMRGLDDIREVIVFPKNKNAQCPMDDSPSTISKQQIDELNINLK